MPREIINIQVGQCGNQVGSEFWKKVSTASPCRTKMHVMWSLLLCRCTRVTPNCPADAFLVAAAAQLCQEHGISKDGMLEDFATQVSRQNSNGCDPLST
jgi:hypothetical protein